MIAGEALGAFGLTEAEAGSDAGATRTRAARRRDGDEWVIDGRRRSSPTRARRSRSASRSPRAPATERDLEHRRRRGHARLRRSQPPYRKMGWHASDTHELRLRRLPRARGPSARRARRGLQDVPAHPRRRSHRDRRARGRARAGVPRRVGRVRARTRRRSAGRSAATSRSRSSAPTWPSPSRTRATSRTRPRGCATTASRSGKRAAMAKLYSSEIAVDRDARRGADPRRLRLHRRHAGEPLLPRREDPRDRRGHERDPAAGPRTRPRPSGGVTGPPPDTLRHRVSWGPPRFESSCGAFVVALRRRGRRSAARSSAGANVRREPEAVSDINRIKLPDNLLAPSKPGAPANYLIIGSDSRHVRRHARRGEGVRQRRQGRRQRPLRRDDGRARRARARDRVRRVVPARHLGRRSRATATNKLNAAFALRRARAHDQDLPGRLRHPDPALPRGQLRRLPEDRRRDRPREDLLPDAGARLLHRSRTSRSRAA